MKVWRRGLVSCLCLFVILCPVRAQRHNVTLDGTFADGAGRHVALYGYSDPLSQREVLLDSTTMDSTGHFQLSFYANYPRLVVLQVERYSQSFYAEPGRTYRMVLDHFDWTQDEQRNVYLDPVTLPIRFLDLPDDELNLALAQFDHLCDSVVLRHRVAFDQRYRPDRRYFDTLRRTVEATTFACRSPFFERYRTYRLAEMEMQMRVSRREHIYDRYIKEQTLPYHDENFMRFFFTLFDHSVTTGSRYVSTNELALALASGRAEVYLDLLGHIPLLRNERVRELAAIQSLYEMYYMPLYYNAEEVATMLTRIGEASKFDEHRTLVNNLMVALQLTSDPTADLTALQLPDEHHVMHRLDSLTGRWVYVAFVSVDDANCVGELQTMAHFYDTVMQAAGDSVAFLTIVCDREPQKMYHFLHNEKRSSQYNWLFLHFDSHYDLLYQLGVVAFPTFLLLRPDGSRYGDDAPAPATGYLLRGPWWPKQPEGPTRRIYEIETRP